MPYRGDTPAVWNWQRWLGIGLLILAAGIAVKSYAADPVPTTFDSIEEAATYAMSMAYKISPYYEVGGVITMEKGKFMVGAPHTDLSGDSLTERDSHDPELYHGVIVGDYHTHPCNLHTHRVPSFSPPDLLTYRVYHIEGFMLDTCTGEVHAFKPGVDIRNPDDNADTLGRIVGHIKVTGQILDDYLPMWAM